MNGVSEEEVVDLRATSAGYDLRTIRAVVWQRRERTATRMVVIDRRQATRIFAQLGGILPIEGIEEDANVLIFGCYLAVDRS